MALYPAAVKRLIPPGPNDPKIKARVAILHVDAGGSTGADLFRYFSTGSGGIESHFTVDYDGTVTQFRDTAWQADANMDANDFAVSIESQGKAAGQWTAAQLASIKALLLWLNKTHGIPLVKCPKWDGSGVGYHILFMQRWAGGPRACPGPDRIKQFNNVLVPWMATGGQDDDMTPEQAKSLERAEKFAVNASVRVQALQAAFKAFANAQPDVVKNAMLDALDASYEAEVTLTPKES